jgi:adenylyltransferase/sulfurtransferase
MAVVVRIPTVLRKYAGERSRIEVEGDTLDALLRNLREAHPDLRKHLYDEAGALRTFVNVYLNDENIRDLDGSRGIREGDELSIVPAVAGGAETRVTGGSAERETQGEPQGVGRDQAPPSRPAPFSPEEMNRYSRHMIIPEFGVEGQRKLKEGSVLLVGTGGLGSPLAYYLAAAGIGRLGLVDFDVVDYTNLQRQIIHTTGDVGRSKLESAREKIAAVNPFVTVETHETRLTSGNALDILAGYDLVVDGTDNFPTRYLVNDACVLLGKPNVYGSIFRFEGQASVFDARRGPCYRCLYPEPPPPGMVPSCAEGGVLGILPGIIGTIQANEAVKLLVGLGNPLLGRLLLFDALEMEFREVRLSKDPGCPVCGENPTVTRLIDYEAFCGVGDAPAPLPAGSEISVGELAAVRDRVLLVDVRDPHELDIARISGAVNIPLGQFRDRFEELDRNADIVVHCRSGVRSARAAAILREAGYPRVRNLTGGILAWSDEIDPSVPKY